MYIKKPWRVVSWNVDVGSRLSLKCDGRHDHAPCAGRETLHTQLYTSRIVSIILEEIHRRIEGMRSDSESMHGNGSSGNEKKKMYTSAVCVVSASKVDHVTSHDRQSLPNKHIILTITIKTKSNNRSRYLWALPWYQKVVH